MSREASSHVSHWPRAEQRGVRRLFCLLVPVALLGSGCEKKGVCAGKDLKVEVSGNHGHAERIEAKVLERGAHLYRLEGGSHDHAFRITEADVKELAAGKSVETRASSANAHSHELSLTCEK